MAESHEQIRSLNARAWEIRHDDIQGAIVLSTTVLGLLGNADHPAALRGRAESLCTLSYCHGRLGHHDIAIQHASDGLSCYHVLGDVQGQATAQYMLAYSYWNLGDYSRALAHARESTDCAEQSGNDAAQASALNIIGLIYESIDHPAEALRYFQQSLAINRRSGNLPGQADNLYNCSLIALDMGDEQQALAIAIESLELHKAIAYHYDLGMVFSLIGRIQAAQGDYEAAGRSLQEALAISEAQGNSFGRMVSLIHLAKLALHQENRSAAREALFASLELTLQVGAKDEQSQCHELLAEIFQQDGELQQSLTHYQEFHRLTAELRDNAVMHQLKNLELMHQIEQTRRETEFYRLRTDELAREIEERERVEAELRQRIAEISALNRVTQLIVSSSDLAGVLNQVSSELITLFNVRGVMIVLFDQSQAELTFVAASDRLPTARSLYGMTMPITGVSVIGQLFADHQSLIIADGQVDALLGPFGHLFHQAELESVMLIPLLVRNMVIGVLVITADSMTMELTALNLGLFETIAGQIAAAIEQVRLFEAAQQARLVAEDASQAKSRFLATMSHEFRTPLTAILGHTQLLQYEPGLEPDHLDQLHRIERAGQHLLKLLNDILDLARIEAGRLDLEEQVVDFPDLIEESLDVFTMAAHMKGIVLQAATVETDPPCELPQLIRVDARRLRQVLINLIGNAIKYTDTGSVTCLIGESPAELRPQDGGAHQRSLRFVIRDTGIGIEPADIPLLMTPFHQLGSVSSRRGGTGLGLAISNELLFKMGSKLHVTSVPGVGSEFWFDLVLTVVNQL